MSSVTWEQLFQMRIDLLICIAAALQGLRLALAFAAKHIKLLFGVQVLKGIGLVRLGLVQETRPDLALSFDHPPGAYRAAWQVSCLLKQLDCTELQLPFHKVAVSETSD